MPAILILTVIVGMGPRGTTTPGTTTLETTTWRQLPQGFPQDKIIAGCSVFIAGHMAISGLIIAIF